MIDCVWDIFLFVTLPHEQPQTIFGGFISTSGGFMLLVLYKELIMAEAIPHITVEHRATD